MKLLTRDQILSAEDRPFDEVEVPEWGGTVRVAGLTGSQREQYDRSMLNEAGKIDQADFKTKLVALSIVDENDEPMFTIDDVVALRNKSDTALNRVFAAADGLSLVTLNAIDGVEKN